MTKPKQKRMTPTQRIAHALDVALNHGSIEGDHHRAWTIDQMVRALTGSSTAYAAWVALAKRGPAGPDSYSWDEGIAP